MAHIGCGGEGVAIQQNSAASSSVYLPTNPLSPSKSESVVSSLITSKLPTGPLFAQLAEPTWTWSVVPYWADILQFSALDGRQYSASAYKAGVEQVRPAFPPPPDEGRVTIYAASYFQGTVGDDGVTLQLNGETFSGIPSGAPVLDNGGGVTRTDTITREDGSSVSKQWHLYPIADGSGSGFAPGPYTAVQRYLTVIPSQAGVGFRNVGASGVNTTLQFDLVTQGTPQPTLNTWTVAVVQSNNTTNQPFHVFSPTSDSRGPGIVSTLSNGVHVDLPWDRKNSSGNVIEGDFTWVLAANATLPGGTAGAAANTTYKLDQQTEKGIRISDPPTANDFDPTAGENTTLKFDVTTTGITEPTINWNVTVLDSANTTYYQEKGTSTDGSTSIHVTTTPWLGNNTSGNIISGPFTWVIAANTTATVAGPGGGVAETATNVSYESNAGAGPELIVQGPTGQVGVAFHVNRLDDTPENLTARRKLLRNVVPDRTSDWVLVAKNLKFKENVIPKEIKAQVTSTVSQIQRPVTLKRIGTTQNFKSEKLGESFINLSVGSIGTSYTVADFSTFDIAREFASKVIGVLQDVFPGPAASFGTLTEVSAVNATVRTDSRNEDPSFPGRKNPIDDTDDHTENYAPTVGSLGDSGSTPNDNFSKGGFEAVRVKITDSDGTVEASSQLTTVVKVAHPASTFVVNLHGDHTGSLELLKDAGGAIDYVPGQSALPTTIKTLALISCEALDLHDYNGFFTSNRFPAGADRGYTANASIAGSPPRTFGGRKWLDNTPSSVEVLLGYAAPVQTAVTKEVTDKYLIQLSEKSYPTRPETGSHDKRIIAWLLANRAVARSSPEGIGWNCYNACAYDKRQGRYYFISYEPPGGSYYIPNPKTGELEFKMPHVLGEGVKEHGIWQILPENRDKDPITSRVTGGWEIPPTTVGQKVVE